MRFSNEAFIEKIPAGDRRALARLITLTENNVPRAREVCKALFTHSGSAHVVGVTGSPGSGKSTLVDQMARALSTQGKKVAILAVDPSSPFSGGAVLGDRIRMQTAIEQDHVFVRSMATRGSLGGLSRATMDTIQIIDAAGFDVIIVETVGVGQQEVDIVKIADTCVVVLVPGMGDSVQAIKAGILEIADHFVINKSDREGADRLHKDIRILLSLADNLKGDYMPSIIKTMALKGEGVDDLIQAVFEHKSWLDTTQEGKNRRIENFEEGIKKLARDLTFEKLILSESEYIHELAIQVYERTLDPYGAVQSLLKRKKLDIGI